MNLVLKLFLLLFCIESGAAYAQHNERNRLPKAILVMLNTESTRLAYLKQHGYKKKYEKLSADVKKVSLCMRRDFYDNFSLYPVYFFDDTNLNKVKEGNLNGILMNAEGDVLNKTALNDNTTDFFIVYFGYPTMTGVNKERLIKENSDEAITFHDDRGKYLVVCNNRMEQITYVAKRPSEYLLGAPDEVRPYYYVSRTFDLMYWPNAEKLAAKLEGMPLDFY